MPDYQRCTVLPQTHFEKDLFSMVMFSIESPKCRAASAKAFLLKTKKHLLTYLKQQLEVSTLIFNILNIKYSTLIFFS